MAHVTLTLDEYEALRSLIGSERESEGAELAAATTDKPKRKVTAANRAYAKAFKKVQPRFMKKSGGWKKNGFRNCSRAAHRMCK